MEYINISSNKRIHKESISSEESTLSSNSFYDSLKKLDDDDFSFPKLKPERKISVESKLPEKFKEILPINKKETPVLHRGGVSSQ